MSIKNVDKKTKPIFRLIDPSSQGASRLFVLPLENEAQQISYKRHYLLTVEMKN